MTPSRMTPGGSVFVAGHRGLVGSALVRGLQRHGYTRIITRTHAELDLTDSLAVRAFFLDQKPDFVLLAAAKVGGILANDTYPAEFLEENLRIQVNVISASREFNVKRLLFLGSSCIYPKLCPQPIKEEYLLTGPLEPTNRAYAIAKIAGVEMCWAYNRQYGTRFIAVMPSNLYGIEDNFNLTTSHVLPALLRKAVEAKRTGAPKMTIWGTGTPRRELLHVDDLAEGTLFLLGLDDSRYAALLSMNHPPLVNIGTGEDISIRELAEMIAGIVGYTGTLTLDTTKPDGTPRKLMDVSRIHQLGWYHRIPLSEGIRHVYAAVQQQL